MVDMAHIAGLVAAGLHPSPIAHADFVTTTTHKTLRGPRGGAILCRGAFAKILNSRIFPGIQGGPLMHVIAAKAVAFGEALRPEFKLYQQKIIQNAKWLAEGLTEAGFDLVSGGTDNHLMLVDLRSLSLTGKWAEERLDKVGLTVNKNTVPYETQSPFITSGIRLGTPSVSARGLGEIEMKWLAKMIARALVLSDESQLPTLKREVAEVCSRFPIYKGL